MVTTTIARHDRAGRIADIDIDRSTSSGVRDEARRILVSRSTGPDETTPQPEVILRRTPADEIISLILNSTSLATREPFSARLGPTFYRQLLDDWLQSLMMESLEAQTIIRAPSFDIQLIVDRFPQIEEVAMIYLQYDEEGSTVTVLTTNRVYDDQLMDRLLDAEIELKEQLATQVMFFYFPVGEQAASAVLPKRAKLLFFRR